MTWRWLEAVMGCGDGSQGGTMGLVLLAEMEGCGWDSHGDRAVVNLRAGRCGSHRHGDAAGVTYPVRAVCKQMLLLHTSTVWEECWAERWSPYLRTPLRQGAAPSKSQRGCLRNFSAPRELEEAPAECQQLHAQPPHPTALQQVTAPVGSTSGSFGTCI